MQMSHIASKLVMPRPAGTETLLRRIYAGQKYPHVYTLSISTGKNQSTKHVVHYTFQHMSTITKLSPFFGHIKGSRGVTQYYKNITLPIGANMRTQRDIQV